MLKKSKLLCEIKNIYTEAAKIQFFECKSILQDLIRFFSKLY